MGLFKRSESLAKPDPVVLPSLSDRSIKFVAGELYGLIWSSAGESSPNQNSSHCKNIRAILREQNLSDFKGTAYLMPDLKSGSIAVQMNGRTIDVLSPESVAKVADRVTQPVPVKCRIQTIGSGQYERCCVTLYHTR